jgi:hypothetical protein
MATHGYLVAVELDDSGKATPEKVADKLKEGVWFMEGIKRSGIDVEYLGEIEEVEEEDQ